MPEYVSLDLETTGLDPDRDRVIEVGAVAFTPDRTIATLERLVDPQRSLPEAVARLTGITQADLEGAGSAAAAIGELAEMVRGRQPVGHGARLDLEFLSASGLWEEGWEILDTLDVARILMPAAQSHSLPILASELGFSQPRPHRALDDADATRQLLLRLREDAAALDERLKESMLALVAPYTWPVAGFFAESLTAPIVEATSQRLFPPDVSYVALGHMHKAQRVGRDTIRYAGSPIPLSFDEAGYRHQVLVVDFAGAAVSQIRAVPVPRLVELSRIRGPLGEVVAELAGLPALRDGVRPFLEVEHPHAAGAVDAKRHSRAA